MWLSFTKMASDRLMRWFAPPPQRTAYFSAARRPGNVLRVSRTTSPAADGAGAAVPSRTGDGRHKRGGHGRDPREVRDDVEQRPLGGQERVGWPAQLTKDRPRCHRHSVSSLREWPLPSRCPTGAHLIENQLRRTTSPAMVPGCRAEMDALAGRGPTAAPVGSPSGKILSDGAGNDFA